MTVSVLVGDDSPMARKMLIRALPADWDISITQASNGAEALRGWPTTDQSVAAVGPGLLRFLTGWLTFHFLDEDQRIARQMHVIAAGHSAKSAFAESASVTRDDGARAALVAALMDLSAVVGERNKALHATNEKLKASSRQLAELNRELEARVAERTSEL